MECWGASSHDGSTVTPSSMDYLGKGGYVKGGINLDKNKTIYIYVGSMGVPQSVNGSTYKNGYIANTGGYNGGGNTSNAGCGGGGSTDIRLYSNGTWNNSASLNSRIIVAGGGGGMNYWQSQSKGGDAGGLTGPAFYVRGSNTLSNTGGEQERGGQQTGSNNGLPGENGSFGYGGSGYFGAGGGGWYGGSGGNDHPYNGASGAEIAGGGGSSFVSGFNGCKAKSGYVSDSNVSVVKYDGITYTFSTPEIWDGAGYKWNNSEATTTRGFKSPTGATENGHLGNGFARITYTP